MARRILIAAITASVIAVAITVWAILSSMGKEDDEPTRKHPRHGAQVYLGPGSGNVKFTKNWVSGPVGTPALHSEAPNADISENLFETTGGPTPLPPPTEKARGKSVLFDWEPPWKKRKQRDPEEEPDEPERE
jgi:hypothetical protein